MPGAGENWGGTWKKLPFLGGKSGNAKVGIDKTAHWFWMLNMTVFGCWSACVISPLLKESTTMNGPTANCSRWSPLKGQSISNFAFLFGLMRHYLGWTDLEYHFSSLLEWWLILAQTGVRILAPLLLAYLTAWPSDDLCARNVGKELDSFIEPGNCKGSTSHSRLGKSCQLVVRLEGTITCD